MDFPIWLSFFGNPPNLDLDMNIPIPSMLFSLGGKCVLNWALVLLQKDHICRSFVGVFSLSLAVVDTFLTLVVTFIHLQGDLNFLGLRLTRFHVCLLVQILGHVYSALHLFIVVITTLEHLFIVSRRLQHGPLKAAWILHLFLTLLLWLFTTFYVFKLSNIYPVLEDVAHFQIYHCWFSSSSVTFEVVILLVFLCLCCVVWHTLRYLTQLANNQDVKYQIAIQSRICSRLIFIRKVAQIFLDTWALFLIFLLLHVVLPLKMPAYLGLNCAWLCFVNSLLIGAALCVVSPGLELAQGLAAVPPDSFCEWKIKLGLVTDNTT